MHFSLFGRPSNGIYVGRGRRCVSCTLSAKILTHFEGVKMRLTFLRFMDFMVEVDTFGWNWRGKNIFWFWAFLSDFLFKNLNFQFLKKKLFEKGWNPKIFFYLQFHPKASISYFSSFLLSLAWSIKVAPGILSICQL